MIAQGNGERREKPERIALLSIFWKVRLLGEGLLESVARVVFFVLFFLSWCPVSL